jgi:phage tail sheath protein FI
MAKYSQVIDTISAGGSESGSVSATMTMAPIVKGSVRVLIKDSELVDDGEGRLIGPSGNGTVNYDLGMINVNYVQTLVEGDTITASYLSKLGDASALYEGDSYNGIKLQFYKDPFSGYGLKVWNATQLTTQTPEENWKDLNFTDVNSIKYFMNRVSSNLIRLTLHDSDVTAVPLLNVVLTLSGGNDDAENITPFIAATALSDFSNSETYDINLLACPDFPGDKTVASSLIQICEAERGDCFAIIDPPQNLTPQQVVNWSNGDGQWANENSLNSSFAALYYPWLQISDPFTESLQWVPPSVRIVSVYAYNDSKAEVWNAPAGLNRGRLFKVQKVERNLNIGDRDLLYSTGSNAVNPICDFVGDGIVVFGQKTLQRAPTALDRVNVMRMILYVTKILATATRYLLFEPNDRLTWIQYTQLVNPLINDIKQRRGLYEFKVVCDETTNTPYDIDNNTMVAEIWMKPTKTAERLINRFIITSTGASFSELKSE